MNTICVIGGGPVGLWCAIELSQNNLVTVYEKRNEYTRSHRVSFNMKNIKCCHPDLIQFIKQSGNFSLKDIENALRKICLRNKVIIHNQKFDTEDLYSFPQNNIIFCDGSQSIFREYLGCGKCDESLFSRVLTITYTLPHKAHKMNFIQWYKSVKQIGQYVSEKCSGNTMSISFIVTKENIEQLTNNTLVLVEKKCPNFLPTNLWNNIISWLSYRNENPQTISIISYTLGMYRAKHFSGTIEIDQNTKKPFFFLGDAAFGTPYYKGLYNGLKCASKLSLLLNKQDCNTIASFNAFMIKEFIMEYKSAILKYNLFNTFITYLKVSNVVPWQIFLHGP
jgi:2-polyprenyl-6-methoxyphenol hydroxylase-like FAD-dependent oxidoreductase